MYISSIVLTRECEQKGHRPESKAQNSFEIKLQLSLSENELRQDMNYMHICKQMLIICHYDPLETLRLL